MYNVYCILIIMIVFCIVLQIGDFISSNEKTTDSFMNAQMLTIASLILLFILLAALVFLIARMRIRIHKERKPKKQVYSSLRLLNFIGIAIVRQNLSYLYKFYFYFNYILQLFQFQFSAYFDCFQFNCLLN